MFRILPGGRYSDVGLYPSTAREKEEERWHWGGGGSEFLTAFILQSAIQYHS